MMVPKKPTMPHISGDAKGTQEVYPSNEAEPIEIATGTLGTGTEVHIERMELFHRERSKQEEMPKALERYTEAIQ